MIVYKNDLFTTGRAEGTLLGVDIWYWGRHIICRGVAAEACILMLGEVARSLERL